MPKCKRCKEEMKYLGFEKNEEGILLHENHVCKNKECPNYLKIHALTPLTQEDDDS